MSHCGIKTGGDRQREGSASEHDPVGAHELPPALRRMEPLPRGFLSPLGS